VGLTERIQASQAVSPWPGALVSFYRPGVITAAARRLASMPRRAYPTAIRARCSTLGRRQLVARQLAGGLGCLRVSSATPGTGDTQARPLRGIPVRVIAAQALPDTWTGEQPCSPPSYGRGW